MLKHRLLTLRLAVMLPFTALLLLTVGIIALAQQHSYERMLDAVSGKLLGSYTRSISNDLRLFLGDPFNTNLTIADSIQRHRLYQPPSLTGLEAYLKDAISSLYDHQPQITTIGFGSKDGYFIGFRKQGLRDLSLMLKDRRTDNELHIYQGNSHYGDLRYRVSDYDPTTRPWYLPFTHTHKPGWAEVYTNQDDIQSLTISAVSPVIDDTEHTLIGMMVTDINLSHINQFLHRESRNFSGSTYIIDQDGRLIASSAQSGNAQLITNLPRPDALITASQQFMAKSHLTGRDSARSFEFVHNKTRYFSRITPYHDDHQLNWHIVVIMPESELLGQLPQLQETGLLAAILLAACGLIAGLFILKKITQPITDIARASQQISETHWQVDLRPTVRLQETNQLASAFTAMSARLQHSFNTLRKQVLYDNLTGLLSREGLLESTNAPHSGQQATLMIIGLKAFSNINDSIGHLNGDQLLKQIAQRLQRNLPGAALLCRVDRYEFATFIPDLGPDHDAESIADLLLTSFSMPYRINDIEIIVSARIGVIKGILQQHGMTDWLRNASLALNAAKRQDDHPIQYFTPALLEASQEKTRMAAELNRALANQEFEVHYQPLIALGGGGLCGAEALVRWRSPSRGLVPPFQFIPLAEENGMINELGDQILRQACKETQGMLACGAWPADFMLHVNLSVRQLQQPDFVVQLKSILAETGLATANLTLEITESRLISQPQQVTQTLRRLRRLGIHIAIDDFGTGYSSLAYLADLPFDSLKIDRAFVSQMSASTNYTPVITAIITLARHFGAEIVAEGVETREQAERLQSLGCHYAQGYYYAKPMPLHEWSTAQVSIAEFSASTEQSAG
ncbi:bifunctional diguanylate cyclase/phosphodiesterase [Photobacterium atrarenae]|uniref:EAL domain-containing protein n=1 Tax=Photobacterium atrarenae TaxID=865757 RepID=A0ABY5GEH9_9GAMM|nr:GGDEF and EAL domain-containing protein [Photobacterium atrarenae]UTV27650.1 EAL domain-containing protein [Photobacterium atrarenae]